MAHPTLWNNNRIRQAFKLALLGATDEDMAEVMGVGMNTFNNWKRRHPEFLKEMNRGKRMANAEVAYSLYQRAKGFTIIETHISMYKGEIIKTPVEKYYPPDSWAAAKFLSLRERELWTDVLKTEHTQTNININKIDFSGMSNEELAMMERIGMKQIEQHATRSRNRDSEQ